MDDGNARKVVYGPPEDLSIGEAGLLLRCSQKKILTAVIIDVLLRMRYRLQLSNKNGSIDFLVTRTSSHGAHDREFTAEERRIKNKFYRSFGENPAKIQKSHEDVVGTLSQSYARISTHKDISKILDESFRGLEAKKYITPILGDRFNFQLFVNGLLFLVWLISFRLFDDGVIPLDLVLFGAISVAVLVASKFPIWKYSFWLTERGKLKRNELCAFQNYMAHAEAERVRFHQGVNSKYHEIDAYLPYAILFGIERSWLAFVSEFYRKAHRV